MKRIRRSTEVTQKETNQPSPPKKKAILFLIVVLVLVVILALLNLIDFDRLGEKITNGQGAQEATVVSTFAPNHFVTPDYEEVIDDDKKYKELDRCVWLGDGSEKTQICGSGEEEGYLAEFLVFYFEALKTGDLKALSKCYSDTYLKENPLPAEMTPQKVYDIDVTILSAAELTSGADAGKTLYRTDFSYCIRQNNGTFRRDIRSDESRAQIVEIMKDGKNCTIVGVYEHRTGTKPGGIGGKYMMTFVWIGVVLLAVVVELLTLKMIAVWLMPAGIVALILSLFKADIRWQIAVFAALSILLLLLSRILLKKYFEHQQEKAAGSIIGTAAIVTEKIDASGTGKVRANGKIYPAVLLNAGIADVGDVLRIDHIEGDTLCCEPAPKRENTDTNDAEGEKTNENE